MDEQQQLDLIHGRCFRVYHGALRNMNWHEADEWRSRLTVLSREEYTAPERERASRIAACFHTWADWARRFISAPIPMEVRGEVAFAHMTVCVEMLIEPLNSPGVGQVATELRTAYNLAIARFNFWRVRIAAVERGEIAEIVPENWRRMWSELAAVARKTAVEVERVVEIMP